MKNELQELYKQVQEGSTRAMIRIARIYYWGLGVDPDTQKAIEWLRSAVENGRKDANLLLGHVYYDMERTPETDRKAWEAYQAACDVYSGFSFYLGRMLYDNRVSGYEDDTERLVDAGKFIEEAFCNDFNLIESRLYLWKILTELGDPDIAQDYYDDAVDDLCDYKDYNNLAYDLWKFGECEKALPYIEKAMEMVGEDKLRPYMIDTYAEVLYGLGRLDEAKQAFDKCMAVAKDLDERRHIRETEEKIKQKFN